MNKRHKPEVWSVDKLLRMDLIIPDYQRPYKWSAKNIHDLIFDIQKSIDDSRKFPNFKYRVGTIILHINDQNEYEIVDGQQRILSLLLLELYLEQDLSCKLLDATFSDPITQRNLHDNYVAICEWFSSCDENIKSRFKGALKNILEVVMITVDKIGEAFQLFDSQNSRGRALYPHDLLKAYHLREIHDKYEMKDAVLKWESKKPEAIRELFDLYLFPLWNWAKCRKCGTFTSADIDIYKGIDETSGYNYARRANKAMPYFILTEPFISGGDFFEMVEHYMTMLHNIKDEIVTNPHFTDIKMILTDDSEIDTVEKLEYSMKKSSVGLNHAKNLFFCALLLSRKRKVHFNNSKCSALQGNITALIACNYGGVLINAVNFLTRNQYIKSNFISS